MFGLTKLPAIWAQAAGTSVNSPALLALRRWCSSLTLSSPEVVPDRYGLALWLMGLFGLLILAIGLQGFGGALRQVFGLRGHIVLFSAALNRLQGATRVLAVTIGTTVLAWTASQIRMFNADQGRDDLLLLLKSRTVGEMAIEQGTLAGLVPFRDVFGLGDNLPLLAIATILLFRATADRWSAPYVPPALAQPRPSGWIVVSWMVGVIYLLYRLATLVTGMGDLPIGGCLILEVVIIPAMMLVADGTLLAWLLYELRNSGLGERGEETLNTDGVVTLLPASMLACFIAMPARYVATSVLLVWLSMPSTAGTTGLGSYARWQLGWGLADLQAVALAFVGLAGAVAWTRGTPSAAIRGYLRILSKEGGHLVATLAWAGVVAGSLSGLAYLLVLSMPTQTWVLAAADSYSHYVTLPAGLLCLAAFVELGERTLPLARLAAPPEAASEAAPVAAPESAGA
ncbi:hypothetical protein [Singulisphaera sp. PoT]|uniref:hypothetical protein n=1 Tax=Singulisphaera sp. PoT TaxID=3411797 RepID=UPI003BF57ED8